MTEDFEFMIEADRILPSGRVYPKEVLLKAMQDAVDNRVPVFLEDNTLFRKPIEPVGYVAGYNLDTNKVSVEISNSPFSKLVSSVNEQPGVIIKTGLNGCARITNHCGVNFVTEFKVVSASLWAKEVAITSIESLPPVTPKQQFINKPCVSSGVCEHDKQKVLDKIRAEIEEHAKINYGLNTDRAKALCWCLNVIDKYKEGEEDG